MFGALGVFVVLTVVTWALESYLAHVRSNALTAAVIASQVVSLTNDSRTGGGLPALTVSPLLTQAAQLKADDMAKGSYYAHVSPDGKTPLYWLDQVGYRYLNAGENLVIDRTTSKDVVDAWLNSPDHRENILRPQFTEIGVGVANGRYKGEDTIYVVQEFGTPYPSVQLARIPAPIPAPVAPATIRTPEHIALPVLAAKPATVLATSTVTAPSNTLVRSVAALAAPVIDTIHVVRTQVATTTAPRIAASSTPAIPGTATTTVPSTPAPQPEHVFRITNLPDTTISAVPSASVTAPSSPDVSWFDAIVLRIRSIAAGVPRLWK